MFQVEMSKHPFFDELISSNFIFFSVFSPCFTPEQMHEKAPTKIGHSRSALTYRCGKKKHISGIFLPVRVLRIHDLLKAMPPCGHATNGKQEKYTAVCELCSYFQQRYVLKEGRASFFEMRGLKIRYVIFK